MTNRFYNSTFNALPLTLIPSAAHNSQYAAVAAGFSALETEIDAASAALVVSLAAKAPLASPVLTGTPTVPTASPATSTTQAASTAFVQTAIAAVNAQAAPTTLSVSNADSVALTAGQHDVATYSGAVTWRLPATPSVGQQVAVTPGNGLYSNVVSRNGEKIMGLSEDMTIDNPSVTVFFRYINSALGWRIA